MPQASGIKNGPSTPLLAEPRKKFVIYQERDGSGPQGRKVLPRFFARRKNGESPDGGGTAANGLLRVVARKAIPARRSKGPERSAEDQEQSTSDSSEDTNLSDQSSTWVWAFDDLIDSVGHNLHAIDSLLDLLADEEEVGKKTNKQFNITVETRNSDRYPEIPGEPRCQIQRKTSSAGVFEHGYCSCVDTGCFWGAVQDSLHIDCMEQFPNDIVDLVKARSNAKGGIRFQLRTRDGANKKKVQFSECNELEARPGRSLSPKRFRFWERGQSHKVTSIERGSQKSERGETSVPMGRDRKSRSMIPSTRARSQSPAKILRTKSSPSNIHEAKLAAGAMTEGGSLPPQNNIDMDASSIIQARNELGVPVRNDGTSPTNGSCCRPAERLGANPKTPPAPPTSKTKVVGSTRDKIVGSTGEEVEFDPKKLPTNSKLFGFKKARKSFVRRVFPGSHRPSVKQTRPVLSSKGNVVEVRPLLEGADAENSILCTSQNNIDSKCKGTHSAVPLVVTKQPVRTEASEVSSASTWSSNNSQSGDGELKLTLLDRFSSLPAYSADKFSPEGLTIELLPEDDECREQKLKAELEVLRELIKSKNEKSHKQGISPNTSKQLQLLIEEGSTTSDVSLNDNVEEDDSNTSVSSGSHAVSGKKGGYEEDVITFTYPDDVAEDLWYNFDDMATNEFRTTMTTEEEIAAENEASTWKNVAIQTDDSSF